MKAARRAGELSGLGLWLRLHWVLPRELMNLEDPRPPPGNSPRKLCCPLASLLSP